MNSKTRFLATLPAATLICFVAQTQQPAHAQGQPQEPGRAQEQAQPPQHTMPQPQNETSSFQPQTLFSGQQNVSGAGGFFLGASNLDGKSAFLAAGSGVAIFNHFFEIGGSGVGLNRSMGTVNGSEQRLSLGYGGLLLGVVPQSESLVHPRAHILLGTGGATINTENSRAHDMDESVARFGVIEPSAGVEVNLFAAGRGYIEASWRHVWGGATIQGLEASDFSSWSARIGFRFGHF